MSEEPQRYVIKNGEQGKRYYRDRIYYYEYIIIQSRNYIQPIVS